MTEIKLYTQQNKKQTNTNKQETKTNLGLKLSLQKELSRSCKSHLRDVNPRDINPGLGASVSSLSREVTQ